MRVLTLLPVVLALFDDAPTDDKAAKAAEKAARKALRHAAVGVLKEVGANDVQKAATALIKDHPDVTQETIVETVDAFQAAHPEFFTPASAPSNDRYIVETTTVFELLGSTVTFREGQIVRADTREYTIARDYDVPLRPLAPIVR